MLTNELQATSALAEAQAFEPAILYWGTPVVLISMLDNDGVPNLAPMSSAWWLGWGCMLGLTESAKTVDNLRATGHCVLNLPSVDQADAVNRIARTTGANPVPDDKTWLGFTYEPDKFGRAGLTSIPSTSVAPPRAAECPVQREATVESIHDFGATNPVVPTRVVAVRFRVVKVHAAPGILRVGNPNQIDPQRWRPLIMSFRRRLYGLGDPVVPSRLAEGSEELWRPGPAPAPRSSESSIKHPRMEVDLVSSTHSPNLHPGPTAGSPQRTDHATTRALLAGGIIAGPLFIGVSSIQALFRDGFHLSRHPLSALSVGHLGWIQIATFCVSGFLVLAGAIGLHRVLGAERGGRWGPRLVGGHGLGLLAAGIFTTDAADGFPVGTPDGLPDTYSWHAIVHGIVTPLAFLAILAACLVMASGLRGTLRPGVGGGQPTRPRRRRRIDGRAWPGRLQHAPRPRDDPGPRMADGPHPPHRDRTLTCPASTPRDHSFGSLLARSTPRSSQRPASPSGSRSGSGSPGS